MDSIDRSREDDIADSLIEDIPELDINSDVSDDDEGKRGDGRYPEGNCRRGWWAAPAKWVTNSVSWKQPLSSTPNSPLQQSSICQRVCRAQSWSCTHPSSKFCNPH